MGSFHQIIAQGSKHPEFTLLNTGCGFGNNMQHFSFSVLRSKMIGTRKLFIFNTGVELSDFWNSSEMNFGMDKRRTSVTPVISFNRLSANLVLGMTIKVAPKIFVGINTGFIGINFFQSISDKINVYYNQFSYDSITNQASVLKYERSAFMKKFSNNIFTKGCLKSEVCLGFRIRKQISINLTCALVVSNMSIYAQGPFQDHVNEYLGINRSLTGGLGVTYYIKAR